MIKGSLIDAARVLVLLIVVDQCEAARSSLFTVSRRQ
jgi:hypothetical protein